MCVRPPSAVDVKWPADGLERLLDLPRRHPVAAFRLGRGAIGEELPFCLSPRHEPLEGLASGLDPASQLRRDLVVLPLVEHTEQRRLAEGTRAHIEDEARQGVELGLREGNGDLSVDGGRRARGVLVQDCESALAGDSLAKLLGLGAVARALMNEVAIPDRAVPDRIVVEVRPEALEPGDQSDSRLAQCELSTTRYRL